MTNTPRILAYGDPHGEWMPLLRVCERETPAAVLIVGDCDLISRPLRVELAPLWKAGVPVWYVVGNHEVDLEACWTNLVEDHPAGNLGNRIVEIGGLKVAGLGGTFEAPLWSPRKGIEETFPTREAYFDSIADHPYRATLVLKHKASIAPADFDILVDQGRADILFCHEAPSSHPQGEPHLDLLAELLEVRLVIHGHHHQSTTASLPGGIAVRSLGRAEPWWIEVPKGAT